jgi:putative ABC transport system permease protein
MKHMNIKKVNNSNSPPKMGKAGAGLFYHYIKIALRNIFKDRIYSLVNIIGLSVATVCCFLVIFWVKFEFSFEDCHSKADRIYKVLIERENMQNVIYDPEQIRPGIFHQLKQTFPEIEASTYVNHSQAFFAFDDKEEVIMVDYVNATPDYFDIFSYDYIEGNMENVLKTNGIVLSEVLARKIFGNESAIGKTISLSNRPVMTIGAVAKIPHNTNLTFDILDPAADRGGTNTGIHYVLVKENSRISEETEERMKNFLSTIRETEDKLVYQPLKDTYFHSSPKLIVPKELGGNSKDWQILGNMKQIYLFSSIALLILAIAIINYVNTSTARVISRMKETGIRKVVGSSRSQLIYRFLSDVFILSAASIIIALTVSKSLFPDFSMMMGSQAVFILDFNTILIALAVCIIITFLSGGYAAFYLSSIDPIAVIQGGIYPGSKERLRKILTGFQFCLSISILISTCMIYKQIHYMFTADTGVERNNIIVIETMLRDAEDFIQTIKQNPAIIDATFASRAPYDIQNNWSGVSWAGMKEPEKEIEFAHIYCDHRYAGTFGLQMIAGEFIQPGWSRNVDIKSCNLIINETFRELMGEVNPIGMTVNFGYILSGEIIGVVKDFNFRPLKEPIIPLIIAFMPSSFRNLYIKTSGNNKKETLDYILEKYREFEVSAPNRKPLVYYTAEDDFNIMYKNELRMKKVFSIFSILSLCLCGMGIFSMVTFMIEKRKKEIAIRRINGAENADIISLFITNFTKIIGIACAIAIPTSYFILLRWIQDYTFRTALSWWIFVLVPLVVALITASLIALQVFFTTRQNPAEVIKMN